MREGKIPIFKMVECFKYWWTDGKAQPCKDVKY